MFNTSPENRDFILPGPPSGKKWQVAVNTAETPGRDIFTDEDGPPAGPEAITVKSRSLIVLIA